MIAVGRIGPPRGIRGEVFVEPFTDAPDERFAPGTVVRTDPADRGPLIVETLNLRGSRMVLSFQGLTDRTQVEALRGVHLVVPASARPAIEDPDEFYASDLVGLAARTVGGAELGRVADVIDIAGADYLVLALEGAERLVPFVAAIVPTVSIVEGFVEIDPPDGLFEI